LIKVIEVGLDQAGPAADPDALELLLDGGRMSGPGVDVVLVALAAVEDGDADLAEAGVVPHDVGDVGSFALLGVHFVEDLLDLDVLGGPLLAVLLFEDLLLGVVDEIGRRRG
jgi:hypothetical protein